MGTVPREKAIPARQFLQNTSLLSAKFGMPDYTDDEGRLITLEYEKFYLITCYTPNSKEGLARIDYRMEFRGISREITYLPSEQTKPVILCGDLNVAHKEIDL